MSRLDARISKLESEQSGRRVVTVFAEPGEDERDCIRSHGHDPEDEAVLYLIVRWVAATAGA